MLLLLYLFLLLCGIRIRRALLGLLLFLLLLLVVLLFFFRWGGCRCGLLGLFGGSLGLFLLSTYLSIISVLHSREIVGKLNVGKFPNIAFPVCRVAFRVGTGVEHQGAPVHKHQFLKLIEYLRHDLKLEESLSPTERAGWDALWLVLV